MEAAAQVCPAATQTFPRRACPLSLLPPRVVTQASEAAIRGLTDVPGDQLRHLEHADLALAVKNRSERIVGVDLSSLCLVL
jgi:hypothetical protein